MPTFDVPCFLDSNNLKSNHDSFFPIDCHRQENLSMSVKAYLRWGFQGGLQSFSESSQKHISLELV